MEEKNGNNDKKKYKQQEKTIKRLEIISKYQDIFDVIVEARVIEYGLIKSILDVSQKTIERAFREIRGNVYANDLIVEMPEGNAKIVFATDILLRLYGCKTRSLVPSNDKSKVLTHSRNQGLLNVIKSKFKNKDLHAKISEALKGEEFSKIKFTRVSGDIPPQCRQYLIPESSCKYFDDYEIDLLKILDELTFGDIRREGNELIADLFCFSNNEFEIVRQYDKGLLFLEMLVREYCNQECNIKINYAVITLESVSIRDFIRAFRKTHRIYYYDFYRDWFYDCKLSTTRPRNYFFRIYKTISPDTQFFVFSRSTGKFVQYGNR